MTNIELSRSMQWTRERSALLAVVCLALGIVGGWQIRGFHPAGTAEPPQSTLSSATAPQQVGAVTQVPGSAQAKAMADAQAAPLLAQLKSDPANPDLLTNIGNLYYDAQQFSTAIDFYGRALSARPTNAAVRTDMATACWYLGNTDRALAEFDQALKDNPDNKNALFNRGLVKWRGKQDAAGATADWEKLLAIDPQNPQKNKIQQMLSEIKNQTSGKPGA
ncbi:MAG TPA: tetratricopeptide repeat protein [Terracidiphilus sp.]|jgi:tetratricopeptide (TPR) repeat protein|nr:tetratricopeptide repeat protein [Terracidiphilus sp.]